MTQLENPYGAEAMQAEPVKTSGLAVTSLVLSLICCVPVTTIPGVLLGALAAVSISKNPARKGMGLALTAIVLGLVFTSIQGVIGYGGWKLWEKLGDAPMAAIEPGLAGDLAGFKINFNATGVSDADAQAFLDEMTRRYGTLSESTIKFDDFQGWQQPPPGQPVVTMPWRLIFDGGTSIAVELTMDSQVQTGGANGDQIIFLEIVIVDAADGDLVFPPPAAVGDGG